VHFNVYTAIPQVSGATESTLLDGHSFLLPLADGSSANLAYMKPTKQSTVVGGGVPNLAVDGSLANSLPFCTQTAMEHSPWWRVDLEFVASVEEVTVWNRDTYGTFLDGFTVQVGNADAWNSAANTQCGGNHTIASGGSLAIACGGVSAQYIYIGLNTVLPEGARTLTICEVEVRQTQGGKVTLPATLTANDAMDPPMPNFLSTCFIPAGAIEQLLGGSECPIDSPHRDTNPNGGSCTTSLVNSVLLPDEVQVFPEPTDSLVASWFQGSVWELKFTQPQSGIYGTKTFSTGQPGDMVVLSKGNCSDAHAISPSSYFIGAEYSAKMTLQAYGNESLHGESQDEKGAAAEVVVLASGKVNELGAGIYKLCYSTLQMEGDDADDFKELAAQFEILPEAATAPSMTVPRTVQLGHDLVVHWSSTNSLHDALQPKDSWVGLFHHGACMPESYGQDWATASTLRTQIDNTQLEPPVTEENGYVEREPHECYVAYQFVEDGGSSGTVIFSQKDYRYAGTYDIRFFQGNSRNGGGRVCKGLSDSPHETYVQCSLKAALVSSSIQVYANNDMLDDLDAIPGMEAYFDSDLGRFKKPDSEME